MHRRARHLNPGSAGAVLALDSRFISGLSDGDPVSTWNDRSGNGNDATGSGTSRPTFKVNEQGGQSVIYFDGSKFIGGSSPTPTAHPRTLLICYRATVDTLGSLFQAPYQPTGNGFLARWGAFSGTAFISGDIATTNQTLASLPTNLQNANVGSWLSDSSRNVTFARNGAFLSVNGNPPSTINTPAVDGYLIGKALNASGTSFQVYTGYIFQVSVFDGNSIDSPLRRRLEHAAAFAFKIPCS